MRHRGNGRLLSLMIFAGLAGCQAVGPDYEGAPAGTAAGVSRYPSAGTAPTAVAPTSIRADAAAVEVRTEAPAASWWQELHDPELDALIENARSVNYDLRVAAANVEAARATLAQTLTRRLPTLDANASVTERRNSSALFPIGSRAENPLPTLLGGTFGFDLTWEIDLFGRVQRSIEAASADLGTVEALREDVMVSVLAGVARAYIDLRGSQTRLDVAARNVTVQRQTLELVDLLYREGVATELDVARARTQLLASEATIPPLEAAVTAALNRLTTFTAQAPGALASRLGTAKPLPAMPPFVAVGEPVDLLRRRPDIRAAEQALAGATARVGVATADLFPTVRFGALGGVGAVKLSNLTSPGAPFLTVGPALTWNLFDRGAIRARIRAADASTEAALASYEATVTRALEEVDSALSAYRNEQQRATRLEAALGASREASALANLRYREGVEDFLTVLDAERSLLDVEDQLAQSRVAVAQFLIDIHLALGGGWQAEP